MEYNGSYYKKDDLIYRKWRKYIDEERCCSHFPTEYEYNSFIRDNCRSYNFYKNIESLGDWIKGYYQ